MEKLFVRQNTRLVLPVALRTEYQLTSPLSISLAALYTMEGCRYLDESGLAASSKVDYEGYSNHTVNLNVLNVPLYI